MNPCRSSHRLRRKKVIRLVESSHETKKTSSRNVQLRMRRNHRKKRRSHQLHSNLRTERCSLKLSASQKFLQRLSTSQMKAKPEKNRAQRSRSLKMMHSLRLLNLHKKKKRRSLRRRRPLSLTWRKSTLARKSAKLLKNIRLQRRQCSARNLQSRPLSPLQKWGSSLCRLRKRPKEVLQKWS